MNNEVNSKPIHILLVEDNPGDIRLTQEALKEWKLLNTVHIVRDGQAAVDFLRRQGAYADAIHPDLILLDLNLPKMGGREVLAEIKSDATLRRIPVVILTTSDSDQDVFMSYDLHANCYVTKPLDLSQFTHVVESIENFWFTIVKLPAQSPL